MARASTGRAKLDNMRRRAKGANPDYLVPRKRGNRDKDVLRKTPLARSSQSHRKRP